MRVWQHAHRLRIAIHVLTRRFPRDERYGITAQVRQSAASIADNIAESAGYHGGPDSARFIQHAFGSCNETLSHLIAAKEFGYITAREFDSLSAALGPMRGMLFRLLQRMRSA